MGCVLLVPEDVKSSRDKSSQADEISDEGMVMKF